MNYQVKNGLTTIPLESFPYEGFFVTFSEKTKKSSAGEDESNFPVFAEIKTIEGYWDVSFYPKFGGPEHIDANVRTVKFENGLLGGQEFTTGRYTFTTKQAMGSFNFTEPLSSGLLGPVRIMTH